MSKNKYKLARSETVLAGAALGVALIEATSAQARTAPTETMRISTRNTPAPSGDMYQAGRGLLAAGDVTGAMAAFRQALLEAPQSLDALNALGVCYDRLGRYDIGRGYYDTALAIDPGSTLVLNNLGYSLYLQGEYSAAIPILQRAAQGSDPAVVAASQRVLAMVAEQMRQAAASNSAHSALAEVANTRAHIELAANGEQRLVLGATAPDNALVAALGDDAALVTIAAPTRDDGHRFRIDTGPVVVRTAANLEDDAGTPLPTIVYLVTSLPGTAGTATLVLATADDSVPATPVVRITTMPDKPVMVLTPPATPVFARTIVASAALRQRSRPVPLAPRQDDPNPVILTAANGVGGLRNRDLASAWLLSSRRSGLPPTGRADAGQDPHPDNAVAAFESDLVELNRFAARMRAVAMAPIIDATAADRDVAVARLEALIARIRNV